MTRNKIGRPKSKNPRKYLRQTWLNKDDVLRADAKRIVAEGKRGAPYRSFSDFLRALLTAR